MDSPLQLSKIDFGLHPIGDTTRTPTTSQLKLGTTLNHIIHFHIHDGYRADELTYIEAETVWVKDARAMLATKIFTRDGLLIATCSQEVSAHEWNEKFTDHDGGISCSAASRKFTECKVVARQK